MTAGFTRPFSPTGAATTTPALPWRFAGDLTLIHFRTDPEAVAAYLPDPITPHDGSGEALLWSPRLICHPVDCDPATLDPQQTGYNVCVIGLPGRLFGAPTIFSAFQWCDQDWLMVLSWFIGATSKFADIAETQVHPRMGLVGSPHHGGLGGQFRRTVSRFGQRIIDMQVRPDREINLADLGFYTSLLPLTGMRHFPDVHIPPKGRPLVHDLCQQIMTDVSFGTPTAGEASLRFFEAANEELTPLQPLEVLGGYVLPMSFLLEGVRVVHDYQGEV